MSIIINKFKRESQELNTGVMREQIKFIWLAFLASWKAIATAGIDPETIDYIIFYSQLWRCKSRYHTVRYASSLATRVKNKYKIKKSYKCAQLTTSLLVVLDWIEGVLQTNAFIKSGMAKRCLVIGSEAWVVDDHDRDSMIYSDGSAIIEGSEDETGMYLTKAELTL
jgi:3-oxoacyl-[acyl-carrier-protein] synthase-3